MSFSIYAPIVRRELSIEDIIRKLKVKYPDLRVRENNPTMNGIIPPDEYIHVYQYGVSVRCIELNCSKEQFSVRINAASAPTEYRLAIDVLEEAAIQLHSDAFTDENGQLHPVGLLLQSLGEDWPETCQNFTFDTARDLIIGKIPLNQNSKENIKGTTLKIDGPIRNFCIGPKVIGRFEKEHASSQISFRDWMIKYIKRSQYEVPKELHVPNTFTATPQNKNEEFEFLVFTNNENGTLLQRVDRVIFDGMGWLPWEEFVKSLPPEKYEWIDEESLVIKQITDSEFNELMQKQIIKEPKKKKPFWKFW